MPNKHVYPYLPTTGVRADFKRLMNDFIAAKTVRYEKFSEIWRKRKFSLLCAGRQSDREAREFLERALLIALEFFLPPYQFQVRVGGLYLLHGIYMTQPVAPKVKVRLTVSHWEETIQLQQEASQQNHLDVVYIFNKMLEEHAFHFCYTPSEMNERTLNPEREDNEINLADEMKEERHEINRLFDYESMEQLSYLLDHYRQMKVNLAGPKASKPDRSLDVVKGSMVEDLVQMLQSFKESVTNIYKHGRAQGTTFDGGESSGTVEQSIFSKRKAIKDKIFARESPCKEKTVINDSGLPDKGNGVSTIAEPSSVAPQKISNSSCEEEDSLEEFVSPSSSRGRIGRKKRIRFSKDSLQKKKSTGATKKGVNSKASESSPPSSSNKQSDWSSPPIKQTGPSCSQNNPEPETQIEFEYIDSVELHTKRGGELASKLKEMVKSSKSLQRPSVLRGQLTRKGTFVTKKSRNIQTKSPSLSKALLPRKSQKQGQGTKPESDFSDDDSDVEEEESEIESLLSKKRKCADRKRVSLDQHSKTKSTTKNGKAKVSKDTKSLEKSSKTVDKVPNSPKQTGENRATVEKEGPIIVENSPEEKDSTQETVNVSKQTNEKHYLDDSHTPLRTRRHSRFKAVNESLPGETSPKSPEKRISKRNEGNKVTRPQGTIVETFGRKREVRSLNEPSVQEISSEEENSSPRKKSRLSKDADDNLKSKLKSPTFPKYTVKTKHKGDVKKEVAKESTFKISKTPLSKIIGKSDDVQKDSDKVKKAVKIIRIVTKGSTEAQEVLKAIQKQKASGKKLLENLPKHLVQSIKVGTNLSKNQDKKEENPGKVTRDNETNVQQSVTQTNDKEGEKGSTNGPKVPPHKSMPKEYYVSM